MQSTERQKFEENWKSAFDGAEMTPSDNVWNSIELDLAGQESATMKKRVIFYQRVAAATVFLALLTGVYAFYAGKDRPGEKLIVKNEVKANEVKGSEVNGSEIKGSDVKSNTPVVENTAVEKSTSERAAIGNKSNTFNNENLKARQVQKETSTIVSDQQENAIAIAEPEAPITKELQSQQVQTSETQTIAAAETQQEEQLPLKEDPKKEVASPILQTAPLVASLEPQETEKKEQKKNRSESTWLSLGAAAGNYSPNSSGVSPQASSSQGAFASNAPTFSNLDAASTTDNKTKVGTAYSVGMAVGKKFGRFVVQSGMNLIKQQIDYTSSYASRNAMNSTKASLADYSSTEGATQTAAYTVNSSMEIVSVPLQAGYMIVDRKFGWLMNAGVSSDFFLRNTLVDRSGQRERFTQSAGSESPYRSVNWSGLVNTELSYKIGQHYRLSLVPGVRYSFNPLLKDPGNSGKPIILDVGFRFKYLFD